MKRILIALIALVLLASCDNMLTRNWGGKMEVAVPKHCKVVSCTWKQDNLWVLYTDTMTNQTVFKEYSRSGLLEGEVRLVQK